MREMEVLDPERERWRDYGAESAAACMALMERSRQAISMLCEDAPREDVIAVLNRGVAADEGPEPEWDGAPLTLKEVERNHILRVFERNDRKILATARALRIDRNTLWKKLKEMGLR